MTCHTCFYTAPFASADWCEYGTSPRGCWFVYDQGENFGARLIAAWEAYFERFWKEPAQGTEAGTAETVQQGSVHDGPVGEADAP